jgi:hypothetical protein
MDVMWWIMISYQPTDVMRQNIHISLMCLRPVCVRLRIQILDLCRAVWPAIVNLRTYERLQEGLQNDHKATCSAVFILLYALTLLLCSMNFWAGFCWKKSWNPRCSYMYSGYMSNTNLRDRQASSYRCQRWLRGPLSVLFWSYHPHYSNIMRIILAIMLIISKIRMAFWVSIHCGVIWIMQHKMQNFHNMFICNNWSN